VASGRRYILEDGNVIELGPKLRALLRHRQIIEHNGMLAPELVKAVIEEDL
jgi:hypothetical protein